MIDYLYTHYKHATRCLKFVNIKQYKNHIISDGGDGLIQNIKINKNLERNSIMLLQTIVMRELLW